MKFNLYRSQREDTGEQWFSGSGLGSTEKTFQCCDLLGVGLLQEGAPELVVGGGVDEDELVPH